MKKKRIMSYCVLILTCLLLGAFFKTTAEADEKVKKYGHQIGPWARYGNLQYGFSAVDRGLKAGYPDVQLINDDKIINHIFKNGDTPLGLFTTSGMNIFTSSAMIKANWTKSMSTASGFNGDNVFGYNFSTSKITSIPLSNGLTAIKGTFESGGLLVTCTMWPDTKTRNINTTYTITNKNNSVQTIYPAKGVDTQLNGMDDVPLYSRGVNQGIYMNAERASRNEKFRMDYIMGYGQPTPELAYIPNKSVTPLYAAAGLRAGYGSVDTFGPNYNKPLRTQMNTLTYQAPFRIFLSRCDINCLYNSLV